MVRSTIPPEALVELVRRLVQLPHRSRERRRLIQETAQLYGVSSDTIYRALRERTKPHATRRSDCGSPRVMPKVELERYCELVAALKVRTSNKKGRHLSTGNASVPLPANQNGARWVWMRASQLRGYFMK